MNTSTGSEKIVFCRDAIAPRRAAAGASGFASPPACTLRALPMTICWFGQMTIHTLAAITMPMMMPSSSVSPYVLVQKSLVHVRVRASTDDEEEPERDRGGRGPAEPPQRAPRELVERVVARAGIHLGEGGDLHEVEEPQQAHPHHADDDVADPQRAGEAVLIEEPHGANPQKAEVPREPTIGSRYASGMLGVRVVALAAPPGEERSEVAVRRALRARARP